MKVVRSLEEASWRRFVSEHPSGNVFHTPEMFEVFSRARGHRPLLWAVTGAHGDVLALFLPVETSVTRLLPRRLNTRSVAYGSLLYTSGVEGEEALALLLRSYLSEASGSSLFTELRNLSDLSGAQTILQRNGFTYEDHLNYLIDLNGPSGALLESFSHRTQKHIRRGLRRGKVIVKEINDSSQVAVCYDLIRKTYRRARVPLADMTLFESAFRLLRPKGMVRFTLAWVDQTPVATSVELMYKDVVYGWYGGMDRRYSAYVPNELLMWHLLEWGVERGYRVYDFGGAGNPNKEYGVRRFKAKFGGKAVCFGRYVFVHSPLLLFLSKAGYRACQLFLPNLLQK